MREVADGRQHGTTGEEPIVRFEKEEAKALRPLGGRPPFEQTRELTRKVSSEACVEVDTNHYSVPWRLIGTLLTVRVAQEEVRIFRGETEVARHGLVLGRRQRIVDRAHLEGIVGAARLAPPGAAALVAPLGAPASAPFAADAANGAPAGAPSGLLRPLEVYEAAVGGGW